MGVNTTLYKTLAFALSGIFSALAGGIHAYWVTFIDPESAFDIGLNVKMIIMAVFGGPGTILGPVVGAFSLSAVSEFLSSEITESRGPVLRRCRCSRSCVDAARARRHAAAFPQYGVALLRRKYSEPPAVTTILEISHVTRRFEGLVAVDDVSFMLQRGEILGVIGPNGAGKTTLISLISGTLAPSSGDILFEGRSLIALPAYRRARLGIGRTFQIMRPFPGLSVLDNVAVGALFGRGGGQAQLAKAREQARVQLDFVGLGKNVDQRADELGGPGRKRLELAKALAMQPKVLLCDEVMAGLNLVEIEEVIEVIRKVRNEGISVLVIEHVIKAIRSLSDRLLVLNHGVKIAEGDPGSVLSNQAVIEAYLGKRRA